MASASKTVDHEVIRKWAESRGGRPARVETSGKQGGGILRIDFDEPGGDDDNLEEMSWEAFFDTFEENELAFLHQDITEDGKTSRFNKFVRRNDDEG